MRQATLVAAGLTLTAVALVAQHGYSLDDIERGRKLYQSTCSGCHGPDGDRVAGVALAAALSSARPATTRSCESS